MFMAVGLLLLIRLSISGGVKILLVEDEKEIADFVKEGLGEQGFSVDYCDNGTDGMTLATSRAYDAIVLDIMLPGRDGLSILKSLRDKQNNVPVVIITARGETEERIEGLNLGADDYLPKPFYMDELIARLRAVWRRSAGEGLSVLNVADLSANLMDREVRRGEGLIDMTPKEFSLLVYLMRSPGRVLTRTQILEQVWDYHFNPGTNLVDVYIRRLRNKIDTDGKVPLIHTLRGVGYKMAVEK
ncbi:MAG: two-component system OmpR family response regulator [Verrucomicrobiales bacterium]|jgi:two-component system OmpR family response regulator